LNHIEISHRPQGAAEWVEGPPPKPIEIVDDPRKLVDDADTGTSHPHGTRYKPEMVRYHNVGISRTTGIEYTTTLIEAIGVEHKETTR
jgi:limonene-1,2-epoxide hydrolase